LEVADVIGRAEEQVAIQWEATTWFRKRGDERNFSDHVVRKRGDVPKGFSDQVVGTMVMKNVE
jgi:hypothetical protein